MYADSKDRKDLGDVYRVRLQIVEGLLSEKEQLAREVKYDINDDVHSSIVSFMQRWQKELLSQTEPEAQVA